MHIDFVHEGRAIDNWKGSYIWFPLQITSYRSAFEIPNLHKIKRKRSLIHLQTPTPNQVQFPMSINISECCTKEGIKTQQETQYKLRHKNDLKFPILINVWECCTKDIKSQLPGKKLIPEYHFHLWCWQENPDFEGTATGKDK